MLPGLIIRVFGLMLLGGTLAFVLLVMISPYRLERLSSFLNPWDHVSNTDAQLSQAIIAHLRNCADTQHSCSGQTE